MGMQHCAELQLSFNNEERDYTETIETAFLGSRKKTVGSFNGEIRRFGEGRYDIRYIDFPYYEGDEVEGYCKKLAKALPRTSFTLQGQIHNEGSGGEYGDEIWAAYSDGILNYKFFSGFEKPINRGKPDIARRTSLEELNMSPPESKGGSFSRNGFVVENGVLVNYRGSDVDVVVPEGVTAVGRNAFSFKLSLNSVILPDGVETIDDFAFVSCESLKNVSFPNSLKRIGVRSFAGCTCLEGIILPEGIESIGIGAFVSCKSLSQLPIPASIKAIGAYAFKGCKGLADQNEMVIVNGILCDYYGNAEDLHIPEGVTEIDLGAFQNKRTLSRVVFPKSLSNVRDDAFKECSNLKYIELEKEQIPLIRQKAFPDLRLVILVHNNNALSFLAFSSKAKGDNLSDVFASGNWQDYDLEIIDNGPHYKYSSPQRVLGALGRILDPIDLDNTCRVQYIELLNKNLKKITTAAEELQCPYIISALIDSGIMNEKNVKVLSKIVASSTETPD